MKLLWLGYSLGNCVMKLYTFRLALYPNKDINQQTKSTVPAIYAKNIQTNTSFYQLQQPSNENNMLQKAS